MARGEQVEAGKALLVARALPTIPLREPCASATIEAACNLLHMLPTVLFGVICRTTGRMAGGTGGGGSSDPYSGGSSLRGTDYEAFVRTAGAFNSRFFGDASSSKAAAAGLKQYLLPPTFYMSECWRGWRRSGGHSGTGQHPVDRGHPPSPTPAPTP